MENQEIILEKLPSLSKIEFFGDPIEITEDVFWADNKWRKYIFPNTKQTAFAIDMIVDFTMKGEPVYYCFYQKDGKYFCELITLSYATDKIETR